MTPQWLTLTPAETTHLQQALTSLQQVRSHNADRLDLTQLAHVLPLTTSSDASERLTYGALLARDLLLKWLGPLTVRQILDTQAPAPDSTPLNIEWRADSLGFVLAPSVLSTPGLELDRWVASVRNWLTMLEAAFRTQLRVGKGAFWSSAALALAMPWTRLQNFRPAEELEAGSLAWLTYLDDRLPRYLRWREAHAEGQARKLPNRRGCCLRYRLPEQPNLCGTCGRRKQADLDQMFANRLRLAREAALN